MPSLQSAPSPIRRSLLALVIGCLVSPCVVSAQSAAAPASPPPPPIVDLVVGVPVERTPLQPEKQSFRFRMIAGDFADLEVEQMGVDVAVELFSPNGARLFIMDGPNEAVGVEPVALVAPADGEYMVTVQAAQPGSGPYVIRLVTVRPSTNADRPWVDGVATLAQASVLLSERRLSEARPTAERALALVDTPSNATSARLIPFLEAAGRFRIWSNDRESGVTLLARAITIGESRYGAADARLTGLLDAAATAYQDLARLDEAESCLARILAVREAQAATQPVPLATALHRMGVFQIRRGRPLQAEPLFKRALAIRETALGADNVYVAQTSDELATAYEHQGRLDEARFAVERALSIREKAYGTEHEFVAQTVFHLGNILQQHGQYARAEPLFERALAIREKLAGPESASVAETLGGLGVLYHYRGQNTRAIPIFERCIAIQEKTLGPEQHIIAMNLNNLSAANREMGEYQKSEVYIRRALAMFEKLTSPTHPTLAVMYSNLGALQLRLRDLEGADASYTKMIAILESSAGARSLNLSLGLQNLAEVKRQRGELDHADALVKRAIEMQASIAGAHYFTAAGWVIHTAISRERGDLAGALEASSKAIEIFTATFGPVHPMLASCYTNRAVVLAAAGQAQQAVQTMSLANDGREALLSQDLVAGSERAKRDILRLAARELDVSISLHTQFAADDPTARDEALEMLLRRKGRALDVMTDAIGDLRRSAAPEDRALLEDLIDVRTRLASLALQGPGADTGDAYKTKVNALEERVDALESDVSRRSTRYRVGPPPAVTIETVQRAMPKGAALVEFASYRMLNPRGGEQTLLGKTRYAAYVLPSIGPARWVDLGLAEPINTVVDRYRDSLRDPKRRDTRDLARELDRLVMQPVRKLTGSTNHLLISPDAQLNLVPFGALVDERGKYLVESLTLTYLTSGRDLLRKRPAPDERSSSTILADPAFGDAVVLGPDATRDVVQSGALVFRPLPATADEAKSLAALIPRSTVLLNRDATESAVKALHRPPVLHIATHGFFIDGTGADAIDVNPLVRSGLALAGANSRRSGSEDGVLTALETAGLDLWGTQLVVLSACNTGIGETRTGEGVSGLRRALVLAGSESQLISLWSVSDSATRDLMIAFYRRLYSGDGRTDALRGVQIAMLRNAKTSHPFYWAGFILSGEGGRIIDGDSPPLN